MREEHFIGFGIGHGESLNMAVRVAAEAQAAVEFVLNGQQQLSTIRIIGNNTQDYAVVQWQFVQQIGWYPWDRFGSMMNDKIMGTMMEQNLQSLKKSLE